MAEKLSEKELATIRSFSNLSVLDLTLLAHIDALQEENEYYVLQERILLNRLRLADTKLKGCEING